MSIATRTGDAGTTGLMYNRRVSKTHPRVEACGTIDELNAALGQVRSVEPNLPTAQRLIAIQKDLILLMGEIAVSKDDLARYQQDGYERINEGKTGQLDLWVAELESGEVSFRGWATPGGNQLAAGYDLARVACRRAERRVCALVEQQELANPELLKFLNRLSDTLWLLARKAEGL